MSTIKNEGSDHFIVDDGFSIDTNSAEAAIRARLSRKRTKTGCLTCRKRRIKCDEGKPICNNCQKSRRQCEGYNQRIVFKPTDYQYFPHGAATITWHSGFVPGEAESIAHTDPMALGYSELRPRIAPQQQMIDLAEMQLHQHVMQQQYMGMPPPDQGSLPQMMTHSLDDAQQWGMPGPPQGQALPASSLPYYPPHYDQHPHIFSAPGHVVHDPCWQQRHNSIFNNRDAQPPIAQEVYPPAPTPGWQQVPPQLPLRHDSRQHISPERSRSWYEVPPSRIKISQTTTTVEHEWPAQMYAPRPELSQPIDRDRVTHRVMPTPQFQATQLYDQDDATSNDHIRNDSLNDSLNDYQPHKLEKASLASASPTRMLDEAAVEAQDDDYYDINSDDDMDQDVNDVYTLDRNREAFLYAIASKNGLDASVLESRRLDTFIFPGILDSYRPEQVANPLKNPATARVFAHFISSTGPLLTSFARQVRTSHSFLHNESVPLGQQGVWTYSMPMAALHHQGLLQSILAISSLHIAKLQRASTTPSMKHYAYALKRIHHCVGNPRKRLSASTLAASLLLGYYEIIAANHTNWNSHLAGAKQLVVETDFAGMTREFRRMKMDKSRRDQQNSFNIYNPPAGLSTIPYNVQPDDILLDQISDVDECVISLLVGRSLQHEELGHVECHDGSKSKSRARSLDLTNFEAYKDLFWWYCKQDVIQSLISGNALLMDYKRWTDCPPRAPLNKPDAVYGTVDHLILLLGRIADFASRDRERKLRVMKNNGGIWKPPQSMQGGRPQGQPPTPGVAPPATSPGAPPQMPFYGMAPFPAGGVSMPASYQPAQEGPTPDASQSQMHNPIDLEVATANALDEWNQIMAAVNLLADQLGIHFQPLGPEYQQPTETPFGTAMVYRSWDISCFWAIYYMSVIILHRSHPHMPPAAHMAAAVSIAQTRDAAAKIGQIAAGVPMSPPERPLNPNLGAAMCDLCVPLFFSGIQYSDAAQRKWLVERLFQTDRRTGWATAAVIAEGVQTAWVKAAAAGRGPPYTRVSRANFNDDRVDRYLDSNYQVVDFKGQPEPVQEIAHSRRFVHSKAAARLHWAIGIIGGGADDDAGPGPA